MWYQCAPPLPLPLSQELLESADGCPGKYTRGLGQVNLAFTDDREDITSMMMTVVQSLLDKYQLDGSAIGRLEVRGEGGASPWDTSHGQG